MDVSVPCASCRAEVHVGDDFCQSCGAVVPAALKRALNERLEATDPEARQRIKKASGALLLVAVLFVFGGLVMFAMTMRTTNEALEKLRELPASAELMVEGKLYTVERLREAVEREPYQVLVTNVVLAAMMAALHVWSRRSPLPALVTGLAIFVTVHAVSAVLDPKTLFMGLIIKIIAIVAFVQGIRAALELRRHVEQRSA
jgi:hypothetical protein